MNTEPQLVTVQWLDSVSLESGRWMDAADVPANLTVDALKQESVGYLTHETDIAIALAGSRNLSDDEVEHRNTKLGDVLVIPRCSIVNGPTRLAAVRRGRPSGRRVAAGRKGTTRRQRPEGVNDERAGTDNAAA